MTDVNINTANVCRLIKSVGNLLSELSDINNPDMNTFRQIQTFLHEESDNDIPEPLLETVLNIFEINDIVENDGQKYTIDGKKISSFLNYKDREIVDMVYMWGLNHAESEKETAEAWASECYECQEQSPYFAVDGISCEDSLPEEKIKEKLYNMNPFAFENFSKILLEKNGFTDVEVTRRSGDGGIDGYGKLKINDMLSLSVAFQCKRYGESGSVPANAIRDFRGSLTADIDKGIFITTGTFGKGAVEEASVQGKQRIDLIDGESVINQILKYGIGVRPEIVYIVDEDFYNNLGDENDD